MMSDPVGNTDWCEIDRSLSAICNGPHVSHHCPNGDLVVQRFDNLAPCQFCGAEREEVPWHDDEGEHCQVCGSTYSDFIYYLPDDIWAVITPKPDQPGAGLLCPACAIRRASEAGILLLWTAASDTDVKATQSACEGGPDDGLRPLPKCVRCYHEVTPDDMLLTCLRAPDRGPHEVLNPPPWKPGDPVRPGSSLHDKGCERVADPSIYADPPCTCRSQSKETTVDYIEPNYDDAEDCSACTVLNHSCDYHAGCVNGYAFALHRVHELLDGD